MKLETISPEYLELNKQLHINNTSWGSSARLRTMGALSLIDAVDAKMILDYGCGKGLMKKQTGVEMDEYDPAISDKQIIPKSSYDIVICTDVMEHVEPQYVDAVLKEINSLASRGAYFIIYLVPALHKLPDGSNCHRTVQPAQWWVEKIKSIFSGEIIFNTTSTELELTVLK